MITQVELELETYDFGRGRAAKIMEANEERGNAANNGYSKAIYRRFVVPLAEIIREDITTKKPGRRKAHVSLLEPMDPEAVAYLAVRQTLNLLLAGTSDKSGRILIQKVGKAVFHEHLLSMFEEAEPALFHTIANDLDRRLSKSERHRVTVFKTQAAAKGITVPEWGSGNCDQVGAYLIDQLDKLGMVDTAYTLDRTGSKHRTHIEVILTDEVLELIANIKGHLVETMPYYLPCVEAPIPWANVREGGFHTKEMRRLNPFAVRSASYREEGDYPEADMTIPLAAINALQSTAWQINGQMLDVVKEVARHYDMEEILSQAEFPAPMKPGWLIDSMKSENMTAEQLEEFVAWKREKAEWFTQMKLRGTKYGRFYTAITVADKFRNFPAIYFVYFADFRGRLYAQTTGVSPQGSDMQKALIRFSAGKPLSDMNAERWFCINGANRFGFDKGTLDERVEWVMEREDMIRAFAEDPINNRGWQEADKPLQFLAWAIEFNEWRKQPEGFVSHIPVGMDGTCNGLQNFSAMLRDEVGGAATNLIPSERPKDIYQMVADVTEAALSNSVIPAFVSNAEGEEREKAMAKRERLVTYRSKWMMHGMNRKLVKRSVMTLPYGSTRFSCADFIVQDYMKMGLVPDFAKENYAEAAQYLSHFVWDAIGDVVVKASEAMTWLQRATKPILAESNDVRWISPSGFPVIQTYQAVEEHRIKTQLCGSAFLRTFAETATPDKNRHKNGVAPNYIHSFDAGHLHLVAVSADRVGMDLAMIHDDYGTHAADAEAFYHIIRWEFVRMYEKRDYLQEFADRYDLPEPPAKGNLDLRLVLDSPYFFS